MRTTPATTWTRRTAWLMALLCLWFSGGVALRHTDPDENLGPASTAIRPAAFGHTRPPATPDHCAACAWESGSLFHAMPSAALVVVWDRYLPDAAPLYLIPTTRILASPARAPPA